jgi:cell division protein FtsZ
MNNSLATSGNSAVESKAAFKVIGVGGAGGQVVEQLQARRLPGVNFAVVNTDAAAVTRSTVSEKLCLGSQLTRGLGAGGDAAQGRQAAEHDAPVLRALCSDAPMVFLIVGLGGGAGTGAAPVLARLAREAGALVLAVVTLPFDFEGSLRRANAEQGLHELKTAADAVICLPNQRLSSLLDERTTAVEAFALTSAMLGQAVCGICQLLTRPGLIPLDFASLEKLLRGRNAESAFVAVEASGEQRVREVIDKISASPFLEGGQTLADAEAVLVSIAGGPDLALAEIDRVMRDLGRLCREGAQVRMGTAVDEVLSGRLQVTVIASRRSAPVISMPLPGSRIDERGPDHDLLPSNTEAADRSATNPGPLSGELFGEAEAPESTSQFVAPAPELTAQQKQAMFNKQQQRGRLRRYKVDQPELNLLVVPKGRFENTPENIHDGQNLDIPTFIRRNVALN